MQRRAGSALKRKLWLALIQQLAAITFATVLGVYVASVVLGDLLIHEALSREASYFWERRTKDPTFPPPDVYNLTGYLRSPDSPRADIPAHLRGLTPGFHNLPRHQGDALVYVEDGSAGRLYLLFEQEQVAKLALVFGSVPLVLVLVVLNLVSWWSWRVSRRAVSPLVALAEQVRHWDPRHPDRALVDTRRLPSEVDEDVLVLSQALENASRQIAEFVERERLFTRDASHELRTPVTVIRMACDLLDAGAANSPAVTRALGRIRAAAREMEALIEAFLILARDADQGLPQEEFLVNEVVHDCVQRAEPLLTNKPVTLRYEAPHAFAVFGSPRALAVMVDNLLRNACVYTDEGQISVRIGTDEVCVSDTGPGMNREELERAFETYYRGGDGKREGHGIGLSLVRRLSQRFGWPVQLESSPGGGTRAWIRFPTTLPVEDV